MDLTDIWGTGAASKHTGAAEGREEKRARCGVAIFEDIDAQRAGGDGGLCPSADAEMELMSAAGATELL